MPHPLVLVVEPSPTLRKVMEVFFRRQGGTALLYDGALPLMRALSEKKVAMPDLAFVNLALADMGGRECIEYLKSQPHWERIPIIALSGRDTLLSRFMARRAGASAYLPKPFTSQQLFALALRHALH